MNIRPFNVAFQPKLTDRILAALAPAYCWAFGPESDWGETGWTEERAIAEMRRKGDAPDAIRIVVFVDDHPVGFLAAMPVIHSGRADDLATLQIGDGDLYLAEDFVDKAHQDLGLDRIMIACLITLAKQQGFRRIVLRVDEGAKKTLARAQSYGFQAIGTQETTNTTGGYKSTRMVLALDLGA